MLLVCYGTRPEWIKLKPLIDKMRGVVPFKILFVGQHENLVDGQYDYFIEVKDGSNRLDCIVSSVMDSFNFKENDISHVMVQGDTATAYAMALSAFHNKINVIHLEAGMRTYDLENPYPEEFYRQCISKIANIHLTPSQYESHFLQNEKVKGDIHIVGNTVLDNLVGIKSSYDNTVLVTMHRRENHELIPEYFKVLSKLAKENKELQFVLPIHPNPNVQKHRHLLDGVLVVEPMSYEKMISAIAKCRFIISDSGGIQEEASFFNKKVIVCRKQTERVATLNKNCFLCPEPEKLESMFYEMKDDYFLDMRCPYGDGDSSDKIVRILQCVV